MLFDRLSNSAVSKEIREDDIIKVVSLFSGCGGLDLGFIRHGFEVVWANDFNKAACDTYSKNIGNHIVHVDITQIKSEDIPDCDIIIGGSPCQGFSNSNRQDNFLDNPKNFLVREYIRIVKDKNPKIFVLENVPQIITAGNGKFVKEIINELNTYDIKVKVLNSADYGSGEKRKRAIFIGSRIGEINYPLKINKTKTVKECFEGLTDETPNQKDITKSADLLIEKMSHVPQGGNWRDVPKELWVDSWYKGKTHSSVHKRLNLNEPSITITNFRKSYITHPTENRILSVREAARIQGFPDDFVFYGGLSEKQQMVANAVPVELAEAIAKQIKETVEYAEIYVENMSEVINKDTTYSDYRY